MIFMSCLRMWLDWALTASLVEITDRSIFCSNFDALPALLMVHGYLNKRTIKFLSKRKVNCLPDTKVFPEINALAERRLKI